MSLTSHAEKIHIPWKECKTASLIARAVLFPHFRGMDGFADRVRARAKELTMSQTELASAAGLSPQRLNNYLKTSREPDMATLVRIAIALKTTTDWLLGASARIEAPLSAVVHRLLELDGMSPERANALATASVEALRIYAALPNEGDELMRSRMAAQAVWQIRGAPRPN